MSIFICFTVIIVALILGFAAFIRYLYLPLLRGALAQKNPVASHAAFPPKPHEETEQEWKEKQKIAEREKWEKIYMSGEVSDDEADKYTEDKMIHE